MPSIEKIKDWVFPGLITLVSFFIWNTITEIKTDISEMKSDIKVLMSGYNVDHTRIDNLERVVYATKTTKAHFPVRQEEPELTKRYAVLTKNYLIED